MDVGLDGDDLQQKCEQHQRATITRPSLRKSPIRNVWLRGIG
jgi:hypothetical protein